MILVKFSYFTLCAYCHLSLFRPCH